MRCLFRRWCRAVPKCISGSLMEWTLRYGREGKNPRAKLRDTAPAQRPGGQRPTGWMTSDTGRSLSLCGAMGCFPDRTVRCAVILRSRMCVVGWWVGLVAGRPIFVLCDCALDYTVATVRPLGRTATTLRCHPCCMLRLCVRCLCRYRPAVRPDGGFI